MEPLHAIDSGDAIWLRISDAGSKYVSSGALFFRGPCRLDRIRAELKRALGEYPKLSAVPVYDGDGNLAWRPLVGFDLLDNVEVRPLRARAAEVGGRVVLDATLTAALGRIVEAELDPARPLWRVIILHGLTWESEEAFCLVLTTHHSVADGVAYYDILTNLCGHGDRGRHQAREEVAPRPLGWADALRRLVGRVGYLLGLLRPEPKSALVTADRAGHQLLISAAHPVAALARRAKAEGVSLNAMVLALFGRALADYASAHGRCPERIRAVLPVSVHTRSEATNQLVNRLGYFHVALDLRDADAIAMARRIDGQLKQFRRRGNDTMMRAISNLITRLPAPLTRLAHRIFASRASLVVSCFVFPSTPLRLGEASAVNIGAFPVIPRPLNLSSMIVVHGGAVTLYLRSNSGAQANLDLVVSRFADHLHQLVDGVGQPASAGVAA